MGLITRPKKVFQHKLHSVADNILFECTVFLLLLLLFFRGGGWFQTVPKVCSSYFMRCNF